jgi:methionine-rich copper-binding protein CopC
MSTATPNQKRATILAACAALLLSLVLAGTWMSASAQAHTEVAKVKPSGSAKTSIRTVSVSFTGLIRSGSIRVVGPGGKVYSAGRGGRDPRNVNRLVVPLKRSLKAGTYKAKWKAVAADGHEQSGSFSFRLRR